MNQSADHRWKFYRSGGVDQVVLQDGNDLKRLKHLDQKLWLALACPTKNLELDTRTLELLDTDKDGRIRPPEILAAIDWLTQVLVSLDDLHIPKDFVELASIKTDNDAGRAVAAAAKRISSDNKLNLEDVTAAAKVKEEADKQYSATIEAELQKAWEKKGEEPSIRVLGAATADAFDALVACEPKIDDWFTRCRLAAFDARATTALNAAESELAALSPKALTSRLDEILRLPLSRVEPNKALELKGALNPAWADAVSALHKKVVQPLLGEKQTTLTEEEWTRVKDAFGPFRAWKGTKPPARVDNLESTGLVDLLAPDVKEKVVAALAARAELEKELGLIADVEKLIRLRRDFFALLRNFVNFSDFYGRKGAIFQAGTLYLDARSCDLVLYVDDAGKHAALAGLSKAYLLYCDCKRASGEKCSIVAAFTSGDVDNLMVGRNGVFYDRKGRDWDATITKIVENPISIRQALWSPYKRFVRVIEEQVAKRAAAKETESQGKVDAMGSMVATADQAPPPPAAAPGAAPPEKKLDVGTIAALGVAIGGIATFFSSILATFLGLGMWMPIGILVLLLAISGPAMLIAWLKLRQRNIGPLLDANGWAVNARANVNVPFGSSLTALAVLPAGSVREMHDPFAEKQVPWRAYSALLLILLGAGMWYFEQFDHYLPEAAKAATVMKR